VSPALEILRQGAQSAAGVTLRGRRGPSARNVDFGPFGDQKSLLESKVAKQRAVVGASARGRADPNGHSHVTAKFREGQI